MFASSPGLWTSSPTVSIPLPLCTFIPFSEQTFRLNCRKTLIPEGQRKSNMLFETFSESLHFFPLCVNLSIQAHRQANDKPLRLCFIDKPLDGCPYLCFITKDMQGYIGRGQQSCRVTHRDADSDFSNIERYQSCQASSPGNFSVMPTAF